MFNKNAVYLFLYKIKRIFEINKKYKLKFI